MSIFSAIFQIQPVGLLLPFVPHQNFHTSFLRARWPSCHPTKSLVAIREILSYYDVNSAVSVHKCWHSPTHTLEDNGKYRKQYRDWWLAPSSAKLCSAHRCWLTTLKTISINNIMMQLSKPYYSLHIIPQPTKYHTCTKCLPQLGMLSRKPVSQLTGFQPVTGSENV